ncbi:MAG: hypothetical protein PHE54_02800 [Bacilli bacterium]|nr:hypothetical protein [Bacilli bacterium]
MMGKFTSKVLDNPTLTHLQDSFSLFSSEEWDILDYLVTSMLEDEIDDSFKQYDDNLTEQEVIDFLYSVDAKYVKIYNKAKESGKLSITFTRIKPSCFIPRNDKYVITVNYNNSLDSNVILIHEIGHYLDYVLSNCKNDPYSLLSEVRPILLETLYNDMYHFNDNKIRRNYTYDDMSTVKFIIELRKLSLSNKLKPSALKKIYREYINAKEKSLFTIYNDVKGFNIYCSLTYIISYLIALLLRTIYYRNKNETLQILNNIESKSFDNFYCLKADNFDFFDNKFIEELLSLHHNFQKRLTR